MDRRYEALISRPLRLSQLLYRFSTVDPSRSHTIPYRRSRDTFSSRFTGRFPLSDFRFVGSTGESHRPWRYFVSMEPHCSADLCKRVGRGCWIPFKCLRPALCERLWAYRAPQRSQTVKSTKTVPPLVEPFVGFDGSYKMIFCNSTLQKKSDASSSNTLARKC